MSAASRCGASAGAAFVEGAAIRPDGRMGAVPIGVGKALVTVALSPGRRWGSGTVIGSARVRRFCDLEDLAEDLVADLADLAAPVFAGAFASAEALAGLFLSRFLVGLVSLLEAGLLSAVFFAGAFLSAADLDFGAAGRVLGLRFWSRVNDGCGGQQGRNTSHGGRERTFPCQIEALAFRIGWCSFC